MLLRGYRCYTGILRNVSHFQLYPIFNCVPFSEKMGHTRKWDTLESNESIFLVFWVHSWKWDTVEMGHTWKWDTHENNLCFTCIVRIEFFSWNWPCAEFCSSLLKDNIFRLFRLLIFEVFSSLEHVAEICRSCLLHYRNHRRWLQCSSL